MFRVIGTFISCSLFLSSCLCSKQNEPAPEKTAEQKLFDQGRLVYQNNCIACHNSNPKLPGSQGPEVFGSSKELLTARIIHGNYPDGYTPKRKSTIMPALPHLKDSVDGLHQFLNSN